MAVGRKMNQLSLDSSGGNGMGTTILFVSASRDNALQIRPIDNKNELRQGVSFSDDPGGSQEDGGRRDSAGTKLRGHQSKRNNIGGVICVCAVPSLPDEVLLRRQQRPNKSVGRPVCA